MVSRRTFALSLVAAPVLGLAATATAQVSPRSVAAARITFVNLGSGPLVTVWMDFTGAEVIYATISPGQSMTQETYVGHIWRFRRGVGGPILGQWACDRPSGTVRVGDAGFNVT